MGCPERERRRAEHAGTPTCAPSRWRGWAALVGGVALLAAAPAVAQIHKCVDKNGRTTYQQQPCPDSQKAVPLALTIENGGTRNEDALTESWEIAVKEKRVERGMPRPYVIRALGNPREMRAGRSDENAAEVWEYRRGDQDYRVGFRGGVVSFYNDVETNAAPASTPDFVSARAALAPGMDCSQLATALGNAEGTAQVYDTDFAQTVTRMTWGPTIAEPERTVVTCANGAIARVDRTPATP